MELQSEQGCNFPVEVSGKAGRMLGSPGFFVPKNSTARESEDSRAAATTVVPG